MNILFNKNIPSSEIQIGFGEMDIQSALKILSKFSQVQCFYTKINCNLINIANCSTSSGSDSHSIVGIILIKLAKKFIIFKSRLILISTFGCKTLIATYSFEFKCSVTTKFSKNNSPLDSLCSSISVLHVLHLL